MCVGVRAVASGMRPVISEGPPRRANSTPAGGSAAAKPQAWGDHTSAAEPPQGRPQEQGSPAPNAIPVDGTVTDAQLRKAEAFIEEEEGAVSRFRGWLAHATTLLLVAMSVFHLYAAIDIVPAQVLRPVHVAFVLLLVFLLFPIASRYRNRLMWWDVALAALGVATIVHLLLGGDDFWDRNTTPSNV